MSLGFALEGEYRLVSFTSMNYRLYLILKINSCMVSWYLK